MSRIWVVINGSESAHILPFTYQEKIPAPREPANLAEIYLILNFLFRVLRPNQILPSYLKRKSSDAGGKGKKPKTVTTWDRDVILFVCQRSAKKRIIKFLTLVENFVPDLGGSS